MLVQKPGNLCKIPCYHFLCYVNGKNVLLCFIEPITYNTSNKRIEHKYPSTLSSLSSIIFELTDLNLVLCPQSVIAASIFITSTYIYFHTRKKV